LPHSSQNGSILIELVINENSQEFTPTQSRMR
jgi:hypothetical protein